MHIFVINYKCNTKTDDRHYNFKYEIIMSRDITKTKQVNVFLILGYFQHAEILLTFMFMYVLLNDFKKMKILF